MLIFLIPWKKGTHSLFLLASWVTRSRIIVPSRLHKPTPSSAFKFDMIWPNSKSTLSSRKCWPGDPTKWRSGTQHLSTIRSWEVCFRTPVKFYPWVVAETGWILKSMLEKIDFPSSLWCQQVDPMWVRRSWVSFQMTGNTHCIYFLRWMRREFPWVFRILSIWFGNLAYCFACSWSTELGQRGQLATWAMNNPSCLLWQLWLMPKSCFYHVHLTRNQLKIKPILVRSKGSSNFVKMAYDTMVLKKRSLCTQHSVPVSWFLRSEKSPEVLKKFHVGPASTKNVGAMWSLE